MKRKPRPGQEGWHLHVGFEIIAKLTCKPKPKKYKKSKKRKLPALSTKPSKMVNPLVYAETISNIRNFGPTRVNSMELLRNSILPVTQDRDKVLKWLNTITLK